MVAVPVVAPRVKAVAAPPTLRVVAPVLKILAVVAVVESVPPFTATFPDVVILPEVPVIEKFVPIMLPVPTDSAFVIFPPERSIPVVIPPPPDEEIFNPTGNAKLVLALSSSTNSFGFAVPEPSALMNFVSPVEPVAVVTVKFELVVVLANVKAISLLLFVVIVFPAL